MSIRKSPLAKLGLATLLLLFAAVGPAQAGLFDYEATPLGSYSSLSMTDSGVTITLTRTSGDMFDVASTVGGQPASWGGRDMHNFNFSFPSGDKYNGNFSSGVSAVSIDFGDFGPSDDDTPVILEAYSGLNGTGALLDSDSETWGGNDSFPNFKTLSVASGTPILSIRFAGLGQQFPNSLFWDNIRFDDQHAVPEPASMILLGIGAIGGMGYGWRRRRTA